MENLVQAAELLETSSKLRLAAYWINEVGKGSVTPDDAGKEALNWAGRFLTEVDWTSPARKPVSPCGEFAVQATSVRPIFYSSLIKFGQELNEAGISNSKELTSFFRNLYIFLQSASFDEKSKSLNLNLKLSSEFLEEISHSLLVQLNGNSGAASRNSLWDEPFLPKQMSAFAATSH